MLLLVAAAVLAVILFAIRLLIPYRWTSFRDAKLVDMMPGPPTVPYFGNILQLRGQPEEMLPKIISWCREYGPIARIWVMGIPEVFLTDPEDIEILLNSSQHINKADDYEFLHDWLGSGLLTGTGEKWHQHRKILTPAFHFKILENYIPVFSKHCAILVAKLREHAQADKPVVFTKYSTLCTLDIICETAMGVSMDSQHGGQREYVSAVKRISQLFCKRQLAFWLYHPWTFKISSLAREWNKTLRVLHSFTEKVIKERRAEYRTKKRDEGDFLTGSSKKRLTFLDILIDVAETQGTLTDLEIREEVDTFMFEGHDTTSAAVGWAIFLLGCHPDIQEKVVDELRDIYGDSKRDPEYADLMKMKYLEQVIKESLRLYPSVPGLSRKTDVDVKIKDYVIPPGVNIPIMPYVIHRDPRVFPDPERFNPDHFSPERTQGRHPFAYIPFSAGPRNCIGQKFALLEEKVIISSIIRNFQVQSQDKMADVQLLLELILRSKNDLKIKFTPRLSL